MGRAAPSVAHPALYLFFLAEVMLGSSTSFRWRIGVALFVLGTIGHNLARTQDEEHFFAHRTSATTKEPAITGGFILGALSNSLDGWKLPLTLFGIGLTILVVIKLWEAWNEAWLRSPAGKAWQESNARAKWREYFESKTMADVAQMTGKEFELFLARLFTRMGFTDIRLTPTNDQGGDLICVSPDGIQLVIQAKRWKGSVGNDAVQELLGAMLHYGCTMGMVVTNSTFTPAARQLAIKDSRIVLCDGRWLDARINMYLPPEIPEFSWQEYERVVKDYCPWVPLPRQERCAVDDAPQQKKARDDQPADNSTKKQEQLQTLEALGALNTVDDGLNAVATMKSAVATMKSRLQQLVETDGPSAKELAAKLDVAQADLQLLQAKLSSRLSSSEDRT